MKAVVCHKYGSTDVLEHREVIKPVPGDNEVLVKVHASALNAGDWHLMRGKPFMIRLMGFGLLKPKKQILGLDIAGHIEAVGKNVKQFQPGDEVFGDAFENGTGGYAEYACTKADSVAIKPVNLTYEEAAAIPAAALTALQGLRDHGKVQSWQKVLINGASGGVGTFAVQIAKSYGAEVTAVCSTRNLDKVRSIGADHVIDYTKEDFTRGNERYDLVLAINGYHPIRDYKRVLSENGTYVVVGGDLAQFLQASLLGPVVFMTGSRKVKSFVAKPNQADFVFLKELAEAGKIVPVIDRVYPLSEVAKAIRYLEEEHARGKVVITMPVRDEDK